MGRAKKPEHGFETFDAVLEALAPKPRRPKAWKLAKIGPGKRRAKRRRVEAARAVKAEVHRLTRSPARDRPRAVEASSLGFAAMRGEAVGRWWRCLELMGEGEWTLRGLEGVWTLDKATAFSVLRTLQKRGLVTRAVNPGAQRYVVAGGLMAGRCTRPGKDRWLYRATERAGLVLSGAVEWRRDSHGRPWSAGGKLSVQPDPA